MGFWMELVGGGVKGSAGRGGYLSRRRRLLILERASLKRWPSLMWIARWRVRRASLGSSSFRAGEEGGEERGLELELLRLDPREAGGEGVGEGDGGGEDSGRMQLGIGPNASCCSGVK